MITTEDEVRVKFSGIKVRIWSGQCGKWRYLDEETAWRDIEDQKAKRRKRKHKKKPVPQHVYTCPKCDGYHMTHVAQSQGWRRRKRGRKS